MYGGSKQPQKCVHEVLMQWSGFCNKIVLMLLWWSQDVNQAELSLLSYHPNWEVFKYCTGNVLTCLFVFLHREHCQQPDYDSSSHLWGHTDVSWWTWVSLRLLLPRTGRFGQYWSNTSIINQSYFAPMSWLTIYCSVLLFCVCRPAVGVGSWCFHMTLLYEMQVGYSATFKS